MKLTSSVAILFVFLQITAGLKLPLYFSQCKKSDPNIGECIKHNANAGLSTFVKGDKMYGLRSLLPLWVSRLELDIDNNLKVNLTDCTISDLDGAQIQNASMSLENKKLQFTVFLPKASLYGSYDMKGKIMLLPLLGNGPVNITVVNATFTYSLDYQLKNKKEKQYIDIIKHELTYDTEKAQFYFGNLFNNHKVLGKATHTFLNENWKEAHDEVAPALSKSLSRLVTNVIQGMFFSVPYNELFGE